MSVQSRLSPFTYANPHEAAIHFYFVKDNHPDDSLLIKPSVHSLRGFTAKYTQNSNATQVEHELDNTELMPYLERLFSSMMYDIHRCDSVQIDCPGYSSVVLKTMNVRSYLPILRSQIDSLQNSWPLECIGKKSSTILSPAHKEREGDCTCATSAPATSAPATTQTARVTRSSTRTTGRSQ